MGFQIVVYRNKTTKPSFSFVKKNLSILLRFEEIQARTSVRRKGISVLEKGPFQKPVIEVILRRK